MNIFGKVNASINTAIGKILITLEKNHGHKLPCYVSLISIRAQHSYGKHQ